MRKIHQVRIDGFTWYKQWHKNPYANWIHWLIFLLVICFLIIPLAFLFYPTSDFSLKPILAGGQAYEENFSSIKFKDHNKTNLNWNVKKRALTLPLGGQGSWNIKTADSSGRVGFWSSLDIDSLNNPHISYLDYNNYDLKYAYFDGNSWKTQTIDSAGMVGWFTSLAVDSQNHPHVSYLDLSNGDLKYAYFNGTAWEIRVVDSASNVGWYTSLAVDSLNRPHIAYLDIINSDLKYARFDGSSWQITTVDSNGSVGYFPSITLDSSNNPRISYLDYSRKEDLKYARFNGTSWQIETIDSTGNVGWFSSLDLDSSDNPHISYLDFSKGVLKHAYFRNDSWNFETIDSKAWTGWFSSFKIDSQDKIHISYFDQSKTDLKYAYFDGSSWQTQTIDSKGWVGWYSSLALDNFDRPAIAYFDYTNWDLKYAKMTGGQFNTIAEAQSLQINTPGGPDIFRATLVSTNEQRPSATTIEWYLSNDGGITFLPVIDSNPDPATTYGIVQFPSPNNDLRWKLILKTSNSSVTPTITGDTLVIVPTIDTSPPTKVENLQKTNPDTDNTPTFIWSAATDDIGVASYEVSINGESFVDIGNVLTYTHLMPLIQGSHIFAVRAKDAVPNIGLAASICFNVD